MITKKYDELEVLITDNHDQLGMEAVEQFAQVIHTELAEKDETSVILSLGAAQDSLFKAFIERKDIPWDRINVFHVDAYIGIDNAEEASGAARLEKYLLQHVKPKNFFPFIGNHEPIEEEIERYTQLLKQHEPCLSILGIGWTGHVAFNDPPCDLREDYLVKAVALDEKSRQQILSVGFFKRIEDVPKYGITLTMKALLDTKRVLALVHQEEKATVIKEALEKPISLWCPASYLRQQPHATLYLSAEAASRLSL